MYDNIIMTKKLTILIPTMNRSIFLIRQLRYYSEMGFQGCICIGDSSNKEQLSYTKKALENLNKELHIIHKEFPELNEFMCTQQLVKLVNTPYVVWVADDDFLVPSGLNMCVDFLENNKEFSAAQGMAVRIKTKDSIAYGDIIECTKKRLPVACAKTASKRYLSLMLHYADVHFTVHRIDTRSLMYKFVNLIPDKSFSSTLLPSCLSVINGKTKELKCLSLVRQINDNRYFSVEQGDTYLWITNPQWLSFLKIFNEIISKELTRVDGIGSAKANEIAKQGIAMFIARRMKSESTMFYSKHSILNSESRLSYFNSLKKLKSVINGMPLTRLLIGKFYSLIFQSSEKQYDMSLKSLLKPSSPYHKDFMPIYRAITEENE